MVIIALGLGRSLDNLSVRCPICRLDKKKYSGLMLYRRYWKGLYGKSVMTRVYKLSQRPIQTESGEKANVYGFHSAI